MFTRNIINVLLNVCYTYLNHSCPIEVLDRLLIHLPLHIPHTQPRGHIEVNREVAVRLVDLLEVVEVVKAENIVKLEKKRY